MINKDNRLLILLLMVWSKEMDLTTDSPSSSSGMIILRTKSYGENLRVCMGIFTTALGKPCPHSYCNFKLWTSLRVMPQSLTLYMIQLFLSEVKHGQMRQTHYQILRTTNVVLIRWRWEKFTLLRRLRQQNCTSP